MAGFSNDLGTSQVYRPESLPVCGSCTIIYDSDESLRTHSKGFPSILPTPYAPSNLITFTFYEEKHLCFQDYSHCAKA